MQLTCQRHGVLASIEGSHGHHIDAQTNDILRYPVLFLSLSLSFPPFTVLISCVFSPLVRSFSL
jgi:hypothetical protein